MKIKGLFFAVLFLVTLFSVPVFANGLYIGIEGGLAVPSSSDFVHTVSTLAIAKGEAEMDTGFMIGGTVGYSFSKYRIEGELVYRNNDFNEVGLAAPVSFSVPATGEVTVTSLLLNAYYDIKVSEMISPYLGAGAGYSWVSIDLAIPEQTLMGLVDIPELKLIDDESDSSPAVQLSVGIGISVIPQVIIDVGYRYFWTGPIAIAGLTSYDFSVSDYSSHNFMVGARYNF